MEGLDNQVKNSLSFLDNEYINAGVSLFLILYTGLVAPKLPKSIADFLDSTLGKFIMFFMIIYISRKDTTIAIIAAVAVIISIMALDKLKLNEHMTNLSKLNEIKEMSEDITELTEDMIAEKRMNEIQGNIDQGNNESEEAMVESESMVDSEAIGPLGVESELTEKLSNVDDVKNTVGEMIEQAGLELDDNGPTGISEESLESLEEVDNLSESLLEEQELLEEVQQELEDDSGIEGISESDNFSSVESEDVIEETDQEVDEENELSEDEIDDDDEEVNMEELDDSMINEVLERKKKDEAKGIKVGPKKLKFYCKCVLRKYKKQLQSVSNLVMN